MENVVLFDPSIRSLNKGDEIIMRSAEAQIAHLLEGRYVIKSATHAPIVTFYQNTHLNPRMRFYDDAKYKFICGSSLIWKNMFKPRPTFNVNWFNCMPYKNSILLGCGIAQTESKLNFYTKELYSKILSKDYIHSVRDDEAADFIQSMGYKAINTGCPTMWQFTEDFCSHIPTKKASKVVFTLTDFSKSPEPDQLLIDILKKEYETLYFWVQGAFDEEYFRTFNNIEGIHIVNPTLDAYSQLLSGGDIDYVGTRLHAGMFALQHQVRTIIIVIDNRTRAMNEAYDLHVIERDAIGTELANKINSVFPTNINICETRIKEWLRQF